MYGCESWTIKKVEHRKIHAFELWCWRKLLRVPWTARRSNQSILKEINPEYSSEGLILKWKVQYFDHLIRRTDSLEKTLMLGQIEGRWRRGQQRMRHHGPISSFHQPWQPRICFLFVWICLSWTFHIIYDLSCLASFQSIVFSRSIAL